MLVDYRPGGGFRTYAIDTGIAKEEISLLHSHNLNLTNSNGFIYIDTRSAALKRPIIFVTRGIREKVLIH
jgi:hypothetical protein